MMTAAEQRSPHRSRGWPLGLVCFLFSPLCTLAAIDTAGLQAKAREVLVRALREESGFVRIHAAEALLDTGRGDMVRAAFPPGSRAAGTMTSAVPRIGTWRVLALASATPAERDEWIRNVREVALDPAAPDQLQALETLGKLHVRLDPGELQAIRQFAIDSAPAAAPLPWWVLHLNGAPDALARIVAGLNAADPVARLRASYILKRDRLTGDGACPALARAWTAEPPDSVAYPYLLCALAMLADEPAQKRDYVDRLGGLLADQKTSARYEICLTLMQLWPAENAPRFMPVLDSSDPDSRIGAACAILHLTAAPSSPEPVVTGAGKIGTAGH